MFLDQFKNKTILAWLYYHQFYEGDSGNLNKVCYVNPLYVIQNNLYTKLDPKEFPNHGSIAVRVQGSGSAESVFKHFGPLVQLRINSEPYFNPESKHIYSIKYNPDFGNRSDLLIEAFSGAGFYQIIDINQPIDYVKKHRQIPLPNCHIFTTAILLRQNFKLYGPFTWDTKNKFLSLDGLKNYQYLVGQYNEYEYSSKIMSIPDESQCDAAELMPRTAIPSPDKCKEHDDWISDETLINSFMETIRAENNYSRDQIAKLKDMARSLVKTASSVQFSYERKLKIKSLLIGITRIEEACNEIVRFALGEERFHDLLINELITKHLDGIKDHLLEFTELNDSLRELKREEADLKHKVQQLKQDTAAEMETAKKLAEQNAKRAAAQAQVQSVLNQIPMTPELRFQLDQLLDMPESPVPLPSEDHMANFAPTFQPEPLEQAPELLVETGDAADSADAAPSPAPADATDAAVASADAANAADTADVVSVNADTADSATDGAVAESATAAAATAADMAVAAEDESQATADGTGTSDSDETVASTIDESNEQSEETNTDSTKESETKEQPAKSPFSPFLPANFAAKAFATGFHKNASLTLKADEGKVLLDILNQLNINMTADELQRMILASANRKLKHSTKLYKAVEKGIAEAFAILILREHPLFKAARVDPDEQELLAQENESLRNENDELKAKLSDMPDLETMQEQIKQAQAEYDSICAQTQKQQKENDALKEQLSATLDKFTDQARQTATLLDSKLIERLLNRLDDTPEEMEPLIFDASLMHTPMNGKDIVKRVGQFMEKAGRPSSFNDVANYLICLTQGFITTFAGEPGTGKTSLCNIIAKALGLATNNEQNRFVEIAVERGWTSSKDFIGYYNPLTKTIEKSNEEAFDAFVRLSNECGGVDNPYGAEHYAPFIIMLDEANLSPMEHYWAAFLKNCDLSANNKRELSLGGNCCFRLPEHLRFMATVNFDHTTEELSPRFLDRSWVIMLEPNNVDSDFTDEDELPNAEDMVPFISLKRAFYVGKDNKIDELIINKWDRLQEIFRSDKCALPIMPRNLKMVRNYCAVACKFMKRESPTTQLAPLDYAFAQKILPTINGTGDNYKYLIDALLEECTDKTMPLSARHLMRMQRLANNNMGFYQFFAR